MTKILDKHAPLKKLSKYKLKLKTKPWITTALQKFLKDYIYKKNLTKKTELHNKYKSYRNILSTLMKKSKQNYFTKFFENNLKNLKNTWKRIKSITSMKSYSLYFPMILTYLSETIDNPKRI